MAYVRRKAFYTMEFQEFPGLHIKVRGMTGDTTIELNDTGATVDNPMPAVGLFMSLVDSWDLEYEDGGSVPVTLTAFLGYDLEFMRTLLRAWVANVLTAPYPMMPAEPAQPVDAPADVDEEDEGPDITEFIRYSQPAAAVAA